jgi:3'-phosphoadenosine 5'-phosphosulfate sulfotransferase (PAPS reductase)/FAD synthetase
MDNKYTKNELLRLQRRPLGEQYNFATTRMVEAFVATYGDILLSFSGGKDSALMLDMYCDIVTRMFGKRDVHVGYADTTNETKAMREYVPWFIDRCEKKYGVNIHMTTTRPKDGVTFASVARDKGVPFISKMQSGIISKTKRSMVSAGVTYTDVIKYAKQDIHSRDSLREMGLNDTAVLALTGWSCRRGDFGKEFRISKRWLPLLGCSVPLTNECCVILKETPLMDLKYPNIMTGEQAEESKLRENVWLRNGCNYSPSPGKYKASPFGALSSQAILYAIQHRNVPLCSDYGEVVKCGDCFRCTKAKRTGCALCGFGIVYDPDRFVRLQETEPAKVAWAFKPRSEGGAGYREICEYSNEYCGTKIIIPN